MSGIPSKQNNFFLIVYKINTLDDKIGLISLNEDSGISLFASKTPPSWVNVLDEVNYEMTR